MQLLKQLFENAGLPADFETKATSVFEAAIKEQVDATVATETAKLAEAMEKKLTEQKEAFVAEQTAMLESFIDGVVTEWATENAVNLDTSIKAELAESFLSGLGKLYKEHNVEVTPDSQTVVESLQKQVAELTTKLDEQATAIADKVKLVEGFERSQVVAELSKDLAATQAERVAKLAQHLVFESTDSFKQKVGFLVEAVAGVPAASAKPADNADPKPGAEGEPGKVPPAGPEGKGKSVTEATPPAATPVDTNTNVTESVDPMVAATLALMTTK